MIVDPVVNTSAERFIPVAKPSLGEDEANAVHAAIMSGWASGGPKLAEFESTFAAAHGKRYGVSCNSGTTALQLALAALGIGPGDRVLMPALTMIAVPNSALYLGAVPVFVDSSRASGNPAPQKREALDGIKAIVVPHLYGVVAADFIDDCFRHRPDIPIIEDCAEAHYACEAYGRGAGSFGKLATWSFYGNKIITAGEMGLVATDCKMTADRLRSLRSHAFTPGAHFNHQCLAYGYRATEMQGALALAQHKRHRKLIARRQTILDRYCEALDGRSGIVFQHRPPGSAPWVAPILMGVPLYRDRLRHKLAAAGVESRSWFVPCHRQEHLKQYATGEYPVADDLSSRGLYLPLWPDMFDDDVQYVIDAILK